MASSFDRNAEKAIPAEIHMISGSHDVQTSADVFNVGSFELPDPAGKAGGACTSALLQVLYKNAKMSGKEFSWVDILREMRVVLGKMGYDQVPQLTSSRFIDVKTPMYIVPPLQETGGDPYASLEGGTRRALLMGINYVGQRGELSGCHNDVKNIKEFLQKVHGFEDRNMTVLMDDGYHTSPTKNNILGAFQQLVRESRKGDVVFVHYSGHGGRLPDDNGDEDDGYDETLIPVDFQRAGQIRDDDLYRIFVTQLAAGVHVTCLMDCCHSGTVMDLPYRFVADGDHVKMEREGGFDFQSLLGFGAGMMAMNAVMGGGGGALGGAASGVGGAIEDGGDAVGDCCGCIMEFVEEILGGGDDGE